MVTDQKHSSDTSSKQEVIRYTKILAQAFGLNEQNAEVYKDPEDYIDNSDPISKILI